MQLADSLEVRIIFGQDDTRDIELRNGQAVLLKANFDLFAQGGRNDVKLFVYLEYIYSRTELEHIIHKELEGLQFVPTEK